VVLAIVVALLLTISLVASADLAYTLVDLGGLPGGYSYDATSVNNLGQVTGYFGEGSNQSTFLYSGGITSGTMTDLGTAGYHDSQGWSINDSGQITGFVGNLAGGVGGVMLYSGGGANDLGGTMSNLGDMGGTGYAVGFGINSSGQITGALKTGPGYLNAFLYSGGSPTNLGTLGGVQSVGNGLNNAGQVTGSSTRADNSQGAFSYTSGPLTDLGGVSGNAINIHGQVAGYYNGDAGLYTSGAWQDLGSVVADEGSTALGINDQGQVVGSSNTGDEDDSTDAFLWTSAGGMVDLNTLIAPGSGWTLEEANAISNTGYIAGFMTDGDGDQDGFLLDPTSSGPPAVPEPGTLSLVGFGLLGLGMLRRRQRLG
jgi:probable HAF family extracellular repeat protein